MSRVINPDSTGKQRNQIMRTGAEILRRLSQNDEDRTVDYIDPETGEVMQLDELGLAIQIAAEDSDFINPHTSLVDSIFRVFLANGNLAMTPRELADNTGRSATTILKTLSGGQIYKGIRPIS